MYAFFLAAASAGVSRGVEAHRQDLELLARHERQHLERARQAVQAERAQHRAVVVDEAQHDGLLAEVVGELHAAAGLVGEAEIERDAPAEPLVEADLRKHARVAGRGGGAAPIWAAASAGTQREREPQQGASGSRHFFAPAGAAAAVGAAAPGWASNFGRPCAATIRIACSIGMRARPLSFLHPAVAREQAVLLRAELGESERLRGDEPREALRRLAHLGLHDRGRPAAAPPSRAARAS
jgi:hypothetical protein